VSCRFFLVLLVLLGVPTAQAEDTVPAPTPAPPAAPSAEPAAPPRPVRPRLPRAQPAPDVPGRPPLSELMNQAEAVVQQAERSNCAERGQHFARLRAVTSQMDLGRPSGRVLMQGWVQRLARACS